MNRPRFLTLLDMLEQRGAQGDARGLTFLEDGEREGPRLGFARLAVRARAVAAMLQERGLAGERALLMYPPGLEFVEAFFGCLFAGVVAVPVYPPEPARLERTVPRLEAIAADAAASALLSTGAVVGLAAHLLPRAPGLARLLWLATDTVDSERATTWRRPAVDEGSLAFLQYTSGSTGQPKGVMISHGGLLHNEAQIERVFRRDETSVGVNWLPLFHDMGLIGALLQPIYNGSDAYLFSPLDFLARPLRWLQAVSRLRAHTSGAPNFAYELCVRKISEDEVKALDLSCWQVAFTGAEPVRAATLDRFAARFAAAGFRSAAFLPCYGLAEATLFVTGSSSAPARATLDASALAGHRAVEAAPGSTDTRTLVSCGHPWLGQEVAIVDPTRQVRRPDGAVGEIWARGPSVARGYFRREQDTAHIFHAMLAGEGPWLRTGDLGFVRDGELYVTGRLKDVIIVAGRNYYPQDLEWSIERAEPRVRGGCTACFAVEEEEHERVVAVVEVDERRGPVEVATLGPSLRGVLAEAHGLRLHALVVVRAGTLPKTTSGKLQRGACREGFVRGTLDVIGRWPEVAGAPPGDAVDSATAANIQRALRAVLGDPSVEIGLDDPLDQLGLDSLLVVELKAELERVLARAIDLTQLSSARTLRELVWALDARPEPASPPSVGSAGDPWSEHVNPPVAQILRAFGLDRRYVRGEGCWLDDDQGRRTLDFTAAYGALPFGFNPPEIWAAIVEASRSAPASLVQPSLLDAAGRLARRLVELAPPGLVRVTFANSGAEANEAAIKMVRSATGRMQIVSADNSYHGKTLGALSATGRAAHQRAFGAPAPGFSRVPFGDLEALQAVLERDGRDIAAVMLEPVQGEGGIHEAPAGYLRGVRALCDRHGVKLVLDEVQTGLGRTGSLFACEHEGVVPDVLTLAKALGGGLIPIGAVLATPACFSEEFALRHSSTFAGNALASLVGLRSLELLTRDDAAQVRHVAACGAALRDGLLALQRRFPALIAAVRGRGFMLGLELTGDHGAFARQGLLPALAEQGTLGYLICSYLLNVEGLRVATALLGSHVLRFEPPLIATRAMCDRLLAALERCFTCLEAGDSAAFVGPLIGEPRPRPSAPALPCAPPRGVVRPAVDGDEGRWGFVLHPLDARGYLDFDAGLTGLGEEALAAWMTRLRELPLRDSSSALLLGTGRIRSAAGASAYGELFAVPATAEELLAMPASEAVRRVREAVVLARDRGARVVGLGAYTSIVTRNGAWLGDLGVPITTGNGLTVVTAVDLVLRTARALDVPLAASAVAIVGATGSIGRAVAIELAPFVGRLILVGNPSHPERAIARLRGIAAEVVSEHRAAVAAVAAGRGRGEGALAARLLRLGADRSPGEVAAQLIDEGSVVLLAEHDADLRAANVVVAATSSVRALIGAAQLGPGAIVCDVSRPSNLDPTLATTRPDVFALAGGGVALPAGEDLGVNFGLAPGLLHACMAETALLALGRREQGGSLGDELPHALLAELRALARVHGLEAVPVRDGHSVTPQQWQQLALARLQALTRLQAR